MHLFINNTSFNFEFFLIFQTMYASQEKNIFENKIPPSLKFQFYILQFNHSQYRCPFQINHG